jgi:hypothetical protein
MGCSVSIDEEKGVVYSTFYGDLDVAVVEQQRRTLLADPRFNPYFSEIIDMIDVTDVKCSVDEMRALASAESPFATEARRAIIAPNDLTYGMARMFQILGQETRPNLVVVRTMKEAMQVIAPAERKKS